MATVKVLTFCIMQEVQEFSSHSGTTVFTLHATELYVGCRTIADGTCAFPKNLFGCGNHVVAGDVKFIQDDIKLECEVTFGTTPILQ